MPRILLADDSPHAQRMGERILREEGFEVVTVTDGQTALVRLGDVDPDVVIVDVSLPLLSGYDICREIKKRPRHSHVRVILTAGLLEPFDDEEATACGSDGTVKKPFEASAVMEAVRPLIDAAQGDRGELPPLEDELPSAPVWRPMGSPRTMVVSAAPPLDDERLRAAVTLALDAAMPVLIDKLAEQVRVALGK